METKFISERGVEDLSDIAITVEESNSKVSDTMFTKFTLPFDKYASPEFLRMYGDFVSYEANNLKNKIVGKLQFENKIHDAERFFQSGQGFNITNQIDFGFEELPNFDKKLSELNLEKFDVADIHIYAKDVCSKKWPETNFNFPRVYSKKYSPDQQIWSAFDGYYNDLNQEGTEMKRNYVDSTGNIFNINIIHPMPHVLYVLTKGFEDAGLELQGDILTDPVLQKKWMFSATEYFTKVNQYSNVRTISSDDYYEQWWENTVLAGSFPVYAYEASESLNFQDTVYVSVTFKVRLVKYRPFRLKVTLNGSEIFSKEEYSYDTKEYEETFQTMISVNNAVITFHVEQSGMNVNVPWNVITYELKSNSIINEESEAQDFDNSLVKNSNTIDLKKAVPDMTFGDFFKIIKNWFNYDLDIVDNVAIMNKINNEEITKIEDFTKYQVFLPKRNFLNKKSWLLQFEDLDNDQKKDSLYFDYQGVKINGSKNEETNEITINGYVMPVKLPKENGYNTAYVMKDSATTLSMVDYDGVKNGQNNANAVSDCDFPALFETHWKNWLKMRLSGQEFSWSYDVNIEKFSQYRIKDYIYAYNNVHIIKNWSKEKISPDTYRVEFTTETIS